MLKLERQRDGVVGGSKANNNMHSSKEDFTVRG